MSRDRGARAAPRRSSASRSSRELDQPPQLPLPRARRPRGRRRRVRRAGRASSRSLEDALPRADHARLADPAGRATRRPTCSRPSRTARRCSRSTTRSRSRSSRRGTPRVERRGRRRPPRFACELKIDGVACALTYERGVLGARRHARRRAYRRGHHRQRPHGPRRAADSSLLEDPPALIEVRGEMYLPVKAFEQLNEGLTARPSSGRSPTRATPRPGSLRQKDPKVTASRPLRLWVHSFGAAEGVAFDSHLRVPRRGRRRPGCRCRRPPSGEDSIAEVEAFLATLGGAPALRSTGRSTAS